MTNVMDLLQSQLTPDLIGYLSKSIGGEDREKTAVAANGVFSVLLNALTRNAAQPEGLNGLLGALDRDHDGSILDDAIGLLSGMKAPQNSNMLNSAGMLRHILGAKQGNVVQNISKVSGLDAMDVGQLLLKLSPVVMGVLGKQKRSQGLDASSLFEMLQGSTKQQVQQNPQASIFEKILDSDGDGNIMDDIASIGFKTLGSLFRR
jgi:hypothetical protein